MRLAYLPANGAWAYLCGDALTSMDGRILFATRPDAVAAAMACGLRVDHAGRISVASH
jgi:hypothetical protein